MMSVSGVLSASFCHLDVYLITISKNIVIIHLNYPLRHDWLKKIVVSKAAI